jgi:pseudaminic acid cytidylyltransferase
MADVVVIPARGGSKRIPRKNIKPMLGVPLIERAIEALLQTELFDLVVVSTDDREIAEVAQAAGAECPFVRPAHLADDLAPTAPVVLHAIDEIERLYNRTITHLCVAYPAAIFVTRGDLLAARTIIEFGRAHHVLAAVEIAPHVHRAWSSQPDGSATMLWPENLQRRSQDLPRTFVDAGQFYWSTPGAWAELAAGRLPVSALHVMEESRCQDIDTEADWLAAEEKLRRELRST